MEYVFGTVWEEGREVENVKTVGDAHTDLEGYCHIERRYPDNVITDTFRVVKKYQTDTVGETCLDWYVISDHNRYIDKFTPKQEEIETGITDTQDAVCTLSEDIEARIAELEDALCELTAEEEEE